MIAWDYLRLEDAGPSDTFLAHALRVHPPEPQPIPEGGVIVRRQQLHGLINKYSRAA